MANKKKDNARWFAWTGTLLFAGLLVGLLRLLGLHYWVPPPPEYGIEVNLGYAEVGMGAEPMAAQPPVASAPEPMPEPLPVQEETVMTSVDEEAPAIAAQPQSKPKRQPQSETRSKPEPQPQKPAEPEAKPEPEKPAEPAVNPLALYPGKRKQPQSDAPATGQGVKPGNGDMGSPTGTAQSAEYGRGGAGGGISFSLAGRTLMSLVKPEYNSEEQGIVVVKIWVNRQGEVIRTQTGVQGTTTMDEQLWATARRAAMGSRFVPKENAPEEQVGTISYKFIIGQ
ncbi:MAG: hypothetical protein K2O01_09530 [Bacteroidales bacterium]|nr:hypothetical protein [Bacteroidales bacterium]